MALIKKHKESSFNSITSFSEAKDAIEFYNNTDNFDQKCEVVEQLGNFKDGGRFLVKELIEDIEIHRDLATRMGAVLARMDRKLAPIEEVMELLKLKNAFVRNLGISILRDYGDSIKYYIVKFLIGDDRDLRIFAINVLGDVNFAESRDMLVELLESEEDINVAMTAVDYLAEIGEEEDIKLLNELKNRFENDAYVVFGVDNAIRMIKG